MSSGYVGAQDTGDHQVVIITFTGKITAEKMEEWNDWLYKFKTSLPTGCVTAVTIRGDSTPDKYKS